MAGLSQMAPSLRQYLGQERNCLYLRPAPPTAYEGSRARDATIVREEFLGGTAYSSTERS